jgi:hypothetical protein
MRGADGRIVVVPMHRSSNAARSAIAANRRIDFKFQDPTPLGRTIRFRLLDCAFFWFTTRPMPKRISMSSTKSRNAAENVARLSMMGESTLLRRSGRGCRDAPRSAAAECIVSGLVVLACVPPSASSVLARRGGGFTAAKVSIATTDHFLP